jgi:hypothetical protein
MADFVETVTLTASIKAERIYFRLRAMPKKYARCGIGWNFKKLSATPRYAN